MIVTQSSGVYCHGYIAGNNLYFMIKLIPSYILGYRHNPCHGQPLIDTVLVLLDLQKLPIAQFKLVILSSIVSTLSCGKNLYAKLYVATKQRI